MHNFLWSAVNKYARGTLQYIGPHVYNFYDWYRASFNIQIVFDKYYDYKCNLWASRRLIDMHIWIRGKLVTTEMDEYAAVIICTYCRLCWSTDYVGWDFNFFNCLLMSRAEMRTSAFENAEEELKSEWNSKDVLGSISSFNMALEWMNNNNLMQIKW